MPHWLEVPEGRLSCSARVAATLGGDLDAQQIFDAAHAALYAAKRLGRDRTELVSLHA